MKFIVAPDAKDATEWLARNPIFPGEPFRILVDVSQAEGLCIFEEELIWINHKEIQQDLINTIEDNLNKFSYIRRRS